MIFNAVLSSKEEQEKSVTITENGMTEITPDSGKTLSKVTITTNVTGGGGGESKLPQVIDKTVTEITAEDLQGVTSIGDRSFYSCISLKSINIPDSAKSIKSYAFYGCSSLTNVTIPDSVTSINGNAFQNCSSLTSVTIPDRVKSIDSSTFNNCSSLTSVTIPDSVTSIGSMAFNNCSSLTSVTIPGSVKSIGSSSLQIGSTTNKATITFKSTTPPSIQSSTFNATRLNKIFVPAGTGEAYKAATNWSKFASYIYENGQSSGGSN